MTGRRPKRRRSASDSDEVERLRRENERLREKVDEQAKQIADAEKQIADLERQLALRQQNSTTTSKPPSSDGLAGQQRTRGRRKKSRRKPGGQPGHPGHSRPLVPTERVNAMVELFPDACRHCEHALPARSRTVVGEARRHQVTELPPIEAHITEYRCHRIVCPACGRTTQAPLPETCSPRWRERPTGSGERLSKNVTSRRSTWSLERCFGEEREPLSSRLFYGLTLMYFCNLLGRGSPP